MPIPTAPLKNRIARLTDARGCPVGTDPKLGQANSPEALQGLTVAFLAGPIVFMALGAACFVGYRLTAERSAEIRRLLDARDAALAASEV